MKSVGVVGAGVMGQGVSIWLAAAGQRVVLLDLNAEILQAAREAMRRDMMAYTLLSRNKSSYDSSRIFEQIHFTRHIDDLRDCELVIENATERWNVKASIYPDLDRLCSQEAIFAVNTSAIPITRIGSLTKRPDRVIGSHFMNPAPLKPTVEVIRGYHTSPETVDALCRFLREHGKQSIVVNDAAGFVTNRVMMLTVNEAVFLVQEGVASPADTDRLFVQCFGHKMGPLETADLIGLDTVLLSLLVLYDNFKDSKYRPSPLLSKMVDAGLLGKKSGEGFFKYKSDWGS